MNAEKTRSGSACLPTSWLAKSIVIIAFIFSIVVPLTTRLTTEYAAPTSVYALQIARSGGLNPSNLHSSYWQMNAGTEAQFPVPAILLSVFLQVTNIPQDFVMFIPVTGLAGIIYLVMARRVLSTKDDRNEYGILFSAIYYAYVSVTTVAFGYVGRGALGAVFLSYFLFAYLLLLESYVHGKHSRAWFVVSALLMTAVGFAYYVSALAIFASCLMLVVLPALAPILSRVRRRRVALVVLALALLIYGPFAFVMIRISGALTWRAFLDNIVLFWATILRIDVGAQAYALTSSAVDVGLLDRITYVWFGYALRLLSIFATIWVFLRFRPGARAGRNRRETVWLFSTIVIFASLSELGYLFVGPVEPTRFISLYGLILLLLMADAMMRDKHQKLSLVSTMKRVSFRRILAVSLLVIIALSAYGDLRFTWYRDIAKPYAYQTVDPAAGFLMLHSQSVNPATITGDADYAANLFFIAAVNNRLDGVAAEPLQEGALALYASAQSGNRSLFISEMHERGIGLLLFVRDGRPIWGDEWGYRFSVTDVDSMRMTLVYNDGLVQIYDLT